MRDQSSQYAPFVLGHAICHVINSKSGLGDALLLSVWQPSVPAVSAWYLKRQAKNTGRTVLTLLRTSAAWACCITANRYMTRAAIQYVLGLCVLKYCLEGLNVYQNRASPQVCAGIRSKHLTSSDLAQLPPESIPAGEFKACTALKHV